MNGLNIEFPIYYDDINGVRQSFHGLVLRKAVVDGVVMSLSDKITGDVVYNGSDLEFSMQEYVLHDDVKYTLVNPPTILREGLVKDNSDLKGATRYSFEFYHPMYMLSNFPFTDVAVSFDEIRYKSQDKTFNWIGKPQDFVNKLNKNLEGTEWVVVLSNNSIAQSMKNTLSEVLSFDNSTIADALKTAYDTWGLPYVADKLNDGELYDDGTGNMVDYYDLGKRFVVVLGLPANEIYETSVDQQSNNPFVFQFGQGVGLKNNSRNPRNNKIVTRIAGYGSERNIPYGYPQIRWYGDPNAKFTYGDRAGIHNNVTINGEFYEKVVSYPIYEGIVGGEWVKLIKHPFTRKHLMPNVYYDTVFKKVSPYYVDGRFHQDYDPDIEIIDYYDAVTETGYEYPNQINLSAPSYEIHEFDDIYPELGEAQILGATPVNADLTDADKWDDTMDDDGNYLQSYFKIQLPQLEFDIYACAAITEEMQINMRSGACIGCTFTVQVDWEDYKRNFYDSDMNFAPNGEQRDLSKYPNSKNGSITVVVQKDINTFGTLMPNIYQYPAAGDAFVVLGISLPLEYIISAQNRLDAAMKSYMLENNVYYFDYPLKFDEHFLAANTNILNQIRPNTIIHFRFNDEDLELFVKQLTIKYNEGVLPQYDITLTDNVEVVLNQIGQVADDVEKLATLISLMRQSVGSNVAYELARKLSKVHDDAAAGLITFLQGIVSRGNADFTDAYGFQSGWLVGNGARIDNQGNAEFESVKVRGSMTASELVFNLISAEEGESIRSMGHGIIDSVNYNEGDTSGTATLKLEGSEYATIKNGDICRGMYNILNSEKYEEQETGEDHNGFRKQVGFFSSYFTVRNVSTSTDSDGNHTCTFRFVLQQTDKNGNVVTNNYPPCEGMKIVAYGNDRDTTRQSCMYISAVGQSPKVLFLTGVSNYWILPENIKIAIGYIDGLRVWEQVGLDEYDDYSGTVGIDKKTWTETIDGETITKYAILKTLHGDAGFYCEDNIYLGGIIDQFKSAAMDAISSQITNLGQARVVSSVDTFVVDCNSNGNILTTKQLVLDSWLYYGNNDTPLTLDTGSTSGVPNCYYSYATQSKPTFADNNTKATKTYTFTQGNALSSGTITIFLKGTDGTNTYTASKTVTIIANRQGSTGENGQNGNNGVSAARLDISPDSFVVDCDSLGNIKVSKTVTITGELYIGNEKVTSLDSYSINWGGSSSNYTPIGKSGTTTVRNSNGTVTRTFAFITETNTPLSSAHVEISLTKGDVSISRVIPIIANWQGETGENGQNGRGIVSVTTYYKKSLFFEGITPPLSNEEPTNYDWVVGRIEPTEEEPYLWRFTRTIYNQAPTIDQTDAELVYVYSNLANPNLLADTEFISGMIDAWAHGSISSNQTDNVIVNEHRISTSYNSTTGHNQFRIRLQVSTELDNDWYIALSQRVFEDNGIKRVEANKWYTLSFWLYGFRDSTNSSREFYVAANVQDIASEVSYVDGVERTTSYPIFTPTTTWTKHSITFKTDSSLSGNKVIKFDMKPMLDVQNVYICMPKLEVGKVATPYEAMRPISEPIARTSTWEAGKNYYQGATGEPYLDIVTKYGKWFKCVHTHVSTNTNMPQDGISTNIWEQANNMSFIATDLLLADMGVIDLLYSQKILVRNKRNQLTASINADGAGSYCIYYPESGNKMIEFSADGYIKYYRDESGNDALQWRLGFGGSILGHTSDDWKPIMLYKLPSQNVNFTSSTTFERTEYYKFSAGSSNQYADFNDAIYIGHQNDDPSDFTNNPSADSGWYTANQNPLHKIDENGTNMDYYIVMYRIVKNSNTQIAKITQTWIRRYDGNNYTNERES